MTSRIMKRINWGIRFPRPAAAAGGLPLVTAPLPERVLVPLNQNIGFPADPLVAVGEQVRKGQPIGAFGGSAPSAPIHAPISGTVAGIVVRPATGRGDALCIEITADGKDEAWPKYRRTADPLGLPAARLREAVTEAGIVGLGGALFPTRIKLNPGLGVTTLILNGVECEPRISCDDALMLDSPESIILGAQIMLRILEADECLIAVKENTAAMSRLQTAIDQLSDDRFRITPVAAIYPAGGEAQLIQILTGIEVPHGGLPWDTGIICQNVATAAAIAHFFTAGEPLISRIVTVTGDGVKKPTNVLARIGTPIKTLIDCAGGYTSDAHKLIMGGPMMGIALPDDELPVTKACNSFYVAARDELPSAIVEMPCIRCGDCATTCPAQLMPQLLLQAKRVDDYERLKSLGLLDCIECGCCDYVCPSQIPLTSHFRDAKQALWDIGFEKRRAAAAKARFDARNDRLTRIAGHNEQALEQQVDALGHANGDTAAALDELLRRTGVEREDEPKDES
jgi:electron transport complex protein RnfC